MPVRQEGNSTVVAVRRRLSEDRTMVNVMTMTNEELDAKVLESIKSGKTRASAVQVDLKMTPDAISMRALDRSLQRLRKRGAIKYGGQGTTGTVLSGWRAVS